MRGTSSGLTWRVQALTEIPKAENEKRPYFAYGSNLCLDRINRRCPENRRIGTAVLSGYRVVCNKKGKDGMNFYAGLVESQQDEVLGALYHLSAENIHTLDGIEIGYYRNYDKFYVKNRETGEQTDCFTYWVTNRISPQKPRAKYWERISKGCRDHEFPEEYSKNLLRWFQMVK
jgi:gamma-glutamylcyclotransferase (GGCT)/AIG2-like uncharacterized protein YtfP